MYNPTDALIDVFLYDPPKDRDGWVVARGEAGVPWLVPAPERNPRVRLEARNPDGTTLFCRWYTYEELKAAGWRVEVRPGDVACD